MTTPVSLLHPDAFLSPLAIEEATTRALDEDLGLGGRARDLLRSTVWPVHRSGLRDGSVLVGRVGGCV